MNARRLNANTVKFIAYAAMLIDHTATTLLPADFAGIWFMRVIGRIAAPVMCFFIAEGYHHTSNLKKYMGRLFAMALISHVPYTLCFGFPVWQVWRVTGVIWSLLMGLVALAVIKRRDVHPMAKLVALGACCLLAYSADWNYIGVLWVVAFGVFRESNVKKFAAFSLVGLWYIARAYIGTGYTGITFRIGIFLAIPLLLLYGGAHGSRSRIIKHAAYWFYPAHLLILYFLRCAIAK